MPRLMENEPGYDDLSNYEPPKVERFYEGEYNEPSWGGVGDNFEDNDGLVHDDELDQRKEEYYGAWDVGLVNVEMPEKRRKPFVPQVDQKIVNNKRGKPHREGRLKSFTKEDLNKINNMAHDLGGYKFEDDDDEGGLKVPVPVKPKKS
jgi:hypothetical protein